MNFSKIAIKIFFLIFLFCIITGCGASDNADVITEEASDTASSTMDTTAQITLETSDEDTTTATIVENNPIKTNPKKNSHSQSSSDTDTFSNAYMIQTIKFEQISDTVSSIDEKLKKIEEKIKKNK
jgi:hypothetical protein